MARVFITGVAGFLGSHLAEQLLFEGHEVLGCDNLLGGYLSNVPREVEFTQADATSFEAMKELLVGVDVLFHVAAAPHEGLSVFSPNTITHHTHASTVASVSAAAHCRVRRVVFCSSMARYGYGKGVEFTEDLTPAPVDPYGVAKVASEMFIRVMAEAHGFEYAIAVPHNIYGPRQKYDDPYRNVLAIMANRMLQGKQPIVYGDGEQKRCFTYIDDAVCPLAKLAESPDVVGEVVNIGPDDGLVTINQAMVLVADAVGFDLDPIHMPPRPQEVAHATCSASKARALLEYEPMTSLESGIGDLVSWIRMRGAKPFDYHVGLELVTDRTPKTWSQRLM